MQVAWSEQKQEWEEWGQYRSWEGARGFDTNEYGPQRPGTIAARRIRDQFAIPKGSLPLSVVIRSSPDALREHASQFAVGA